MFSAVIRLSITRHVTVSWELCATPHSPCVLRSAGDAEPASGPQGDAKARWCRVERFERWLLGLWDVVAVLLCVAMLFSVLYGVIAAIVEALVAFDWSRYGRSPKLKDIRDLLAKLNINVDEVLF